MTDSPTVQDSFQSLSVCKILINKNPEGALSPNHADAVVIYFAPQELKSGGWYDDLCD